MNQADRILIPNHELNFWADFFVDAGLEAILTFGEFIVEPEAIVASLCDLSAPLPQSLPVLQSRVTLLTTRRGKVINLQQRRAQLQHAGAAS